MPSAVSSAGGIVMHERLLAFIAQYLGKVGTGTTAQNKGQCVGLVEAWLAVLGKGPIWGNAIDILANADKNVYTMVRNAPDNYPPAGGMVTDRKSTRLNFSHANISYAVFCLKKKKEQ